MRRGRATEPPARGGTKGNGRRIGGRNFFPGRDLGVRCFSPLVRSSGRGASGERTLSPAEGHVAPAVPVVWQGIGGGVRLGRAQGRDAELSGASLCRMRRRRTDGPSFGFAWILPVRARGGAQAYGCGGGGGLGGGALQSLRSGWLGMSTPTED